LTFVFETSQLLISGDAQLFSKVIIMIIASKEDERSVTDEHAALAEQIKRVATEIDVIWQAAASPAALRDVSQLIASLRELLKIAQLHFEHEERLMAQNNYPGLLSHKRDHEYLIRGLADFTSALVNETVKVSQSIPDNLTSWLSFHAKKYDDGYQEFIRLSGQRPTGS
jgi:hemerythrin-like metal-binding protein